MSARQAREKFSESDADAIVDGLARGSRSTAPSPPRYGQYERRETVDQRQQVTDDRAQILRGLASQQALAGALHRLARVPDVLSCSDFGDALHGYP